MAPYLENTPCPRAMNNLGICLACERDQSRLLGRKNQFDLWQCLHCGAIFTHTQIDDSALNDIYNHYYDGAGFEMPTVVAQSLERVVLSFERFRVTGRILDIGYGEGGLLQIAEKFNWQCFGTEISPGALAYGKESGWIVADQAEDDPRFMPQGFDVVTMIELLEHVPNPQQVLQSAARWLRPGGLLYLTTPNAESLNQRLLGLKWSVIAPPEHIALWTPKGMRHALAKAGFQDLRIRTEGLNPYEIMAYWRSQKEEVNRNQMGTKLNQAFTSTPSRRALKTGINHLLTAFQLGDGLKVYATRGQ
jgi:2-polyprenyl-3-methyl-5-hydroxy-6-metoxy-1,4-benzoquinol methylase